jgi:two-component system sensor histidine kinase GlrK
MIISYLVIVVFVIVIGTYSILKWNQLNQVTNSILVTDQPTIDTEKKMIDSLLSQVRNEQKFLITRDEAFYNLFRTQQSEFTSLLNQLNTYLATPEEKELKREINNLYMRYNLLLTKEIASLRKNVPPLFYQYTEEKGIIVDRLTENINRLIGLAESKIYGKMEYAKKTGDQAALTAGGLAIASLVLGILLASYITGSINRPLKKLETVTQHISEGDFESKIKVKSPAELAALANSVNRMSSKLREIDEMKSGFISHISHELRTPLTSMNEANSLLLDNVAGKLTEKQRHLLEIIKEGNLKMIDQINELLDLSKMEAGMMDYQWTNADMSQLIDHSIENIKLLTDKKGIQINCSVEKNLPLIPVDIDKIQQVLNNLLSNAAKFTPEKGRVEVNARKDGNHFLQISVANTGESIPPDYLTKIFDKFQQAETEAIGPIKGTGLGLSIAKHIVEAHQGKIWAEPGIENGSTFTFLLPMDRTQ